LKLEFLVVVASMLNDREADVELWIASRLEASVGGDQEAEAGDAGPGARS